MAWRTRLQNKARSDMSFGSSDQEAAVVSDFVG